MGAKFRTILNLEIVKSDPENGLIYIKGSIPGSKNSLVFLRKSTKSFNRKTSVEKFSQESKQTVKKEAKGDTKKTESKKPEIKKVETKKTEDKKTVAKEQPKKK